MKDLPFTALLKPTIVSPITDPAIMIGIHSRSRSDLFRRMDPFEKGHFGPLSTEIFERCQLELIYTMSYFQ